MDIEKRIEYQARFIDQFSLYSRSMFYELQGADFYAAKKIFGESQYTGEQLIGFYKYLETDEEGKVQPIFMKYEDIKMYQYHMMAMCLSDDPLKYLKDFHEYCKTLKTKKE